MCYKKSHISLNLEKFIDHVILLILKEKEVIGSTKFSELRDRNFINFQYRKTTCSK